MQRRGGFDLLLHLQLSIRASAARGLHSRTDQAGIRQGTRARAAVAVHQCGASRARQREHVLDSFLGVRRCAGHRAQATALGHSPAAARPRIRNELIPDSPATLVISACSSHRARNWLPERYAAVAEHAVEHMACR